MEKLSLISIKKNKRDRRPLCWRVHASKYETDSRRLWNPRKLRQVDTWISFEWFLGGWRSLNHRLQEEERV